MNKTTMKLFLVLAMFPKSYSANVTNHIQGVGLTNHLINPYFCIENQSGKVTSVAPGATINGNLASGNPYYVGGTLRFGGCDANTNAYLGYAGFNVDDQQHNQFISYDPPKGIHIRYANPAIDRQGNITGQIEYTAIQPNFNILPSKPSNNTSWDFVGVNLSGLEFGKMIDPVVIPNLSAEDADKQMSDLKDMQQFLKAGMNTIRLPLHWGFLQLEGPGKGEINAMFYDAYVKPLLESLTASQVYVIVDLHAYMRYSVFGEQYAGCGAGSACPDGTLMTDASAYQDVWTKLYMLMKQDPKINMNYIMLDLVNEPTGVPGDAVFTIQVQVIKALRALGFDNYILVEGNAWSGLHSWTTASWTSSDGKNHYTNENLFTRENFTKAGITDLSKILINVHQYFDMDFSGGHDQCLTNLKTTGLDGFNLEAFTDYLQKNHLKAIVTEFGAGADRASCQSALIQFLDYMQTHSAKNKDNGFIGWTAWSAGHGWGSYNLRITPASYQMEVLQNYLQPIPISHQNAK